MKQQQAKITVIVTRYKVAESHGLPRNKEKQNGGEASPSRWCPPRTTLWSERQGQKWHPPEWCPVQTTMQSERQRWWTIPAQVNFSLEKNWEGRSLWSRSDIAWGLQPHSVSSPASLGWLWHCVSVCVVSAISHCLLQPPAALSQRWCCCHGLLFQRGRGQRSRTVRHQRTVAWLLLADLPEATFSGAQRETKKASALHHPSFPTRLKEKGNRASA